MGGSSGFQPKQVMIMKFKQEHDHQCNNPYCTNHLDKETVTRKYKEYLARDLTEKILNDE